MQFRGRRQLNPVVSYVVAEIAVYFETAFNSARACLARRMKANGETAATICATLGIGRTTLYRYLAESDED